MHDLDRTQLEMNPETMETEFGFEQQELPGGTFEGSFHETELHELAMELLSVQSEQELDRFIGDIFKKAASAVGGFVRSPTGKALGGILRSAAKTALPAVGGALGSFIPIPGVGTALGSALGTAVSNALEMEGGQGEQYEYEAAKRFIEVAASAAQQAASAPPNAPPQQVAVRALRSAMQQNFGGYGSSGNSNGSGDSGQYAPAARQQSRYSGRTGRWYRRGQKIILVGV